MLEVINYKEKYIGHINLALGYFDSLHLGHYDLIQACSNGLAKVAVFTFDNNALPLLGKDCNQVFTIDERLLRMEELGVEIAITAHFNARLKNMSGEKFIDSLLDRYQIDKIVIGSDYKCGYMAHFDAKMIQSHCLSRGVDVEIIELRLVNDIKISSGNIRRLIECGEVNKVNKLMPKPYFIYGKVTVGRGVGNKILGYPTANIELDKDKLPLKEGVYLTQIMINGQIYKSITNVGNHPTFDDYHFNIESFILDFDGMIYDKYFKLYFIDYIRDTVKFTNYNELIVQLSKDVDFAKKYSE